MKPFNHLKKVIEDSLNKQTFNLVDIEGEQFKEIVIDNDINYDPVLERNDEISINSDNLIINGNGHSINLNHYSKAFTVSSENVIIKNFNFENGKSSSGGVIENTGLLRIDNCTFTNCKAYNGGAIHNLGVLIVDNSTFENNQSTYHLGNGGAIFSKGFSFIFNSKFKDNHSEYSGGAIFNNKTLAIFDCEFKNNSSRMDGGTIENKGFFSFMGAVNVSSNGWGEIEGRACTIKNCIFEDSESLINSSGDLYMEKCVFRNNKNIIYIHSSLVKIIDCLFEKNHCYLIKNTYSTIIDSIVDIENCDFINNKSGIITKLLGVLSKTQQFEISGDGKHWTLNNCHFENNSSNYIFFHKSCDITLENVSFEGNDFELILKTSTNNDKGILKLNRVSFKEKCEDIISCSCNLEIDECKFQKHHRINEESVFDMYESEKKFLNKINNN